MSEKLSNQSERESQTKSEKLDLKIEKTEHAVEKTTENKVEREQSAEKTRQKIEKSFEQKNEKKTEKPDEAKLESSQPKTYSRAARDDAFRGAMKSVRAQLSPTQRTFSKFVHAKPVEITSELLEETIFRPSFLWGGVVGGIIFGLTIYIFARIYNFSLSGAEFIFGLFAGGVVGLIFEWLLGHKKTRKKQPK